MSQVASNSSRPEEKKNWVQIALNSSEWVKMVSYSGKNCSKWRLGQVTLVLFFYYLLETNTLGKGTFNDNDVCKIALVL